MKHTLQYIRKIFRGVVCVGLFMLLLSKPIYTLWLGKDTVDIPYLITGLVFLYCVFDILYRTYGTFINGMGKLRLQMIITSILSTIYIPTAVILGKQFGLPGVLLTNAIVYFANFMWAKIQCTKLINQTATGIWNE